MFAATLGAPEIILIVVVILLLFGATRLPQLARSIGTSVKELQKGLREGEEDLEEAAEKEAD